jgi:branched-chain amino acid transport system substrate-binding protein
MESAGIPGNMTMTNSDAAAKGVPPALGRPYIALSTFTRDATLNTVMGDVKFGKNGESAYPRVLQVQFQGIAGHEADQFKDGSRQVVVSPNTLASGQLIFPYAEAL